MPEQRPGQALHGIHILGRHVQQLPQDRVGLFPFLPAFRQQGDAAHRMLFDDRFAFIVLIIGQQLIGLAQVQLRLSDPPLIQSDVAQNYVGFRIARVCLDGSFQLVTRGGGKVLLIRLSENLKQQHVCIRKFGIFPNDIFQRLDTTRIIAFGAGQ